MFQLSPDEWAVVARGLRARWDMIGLQLGERDLPTERLVLLLQEREQIRALLVRLHQEGAVGTAPPDQPPSPPIGHPPSPP